MIGARRAMQRGPHDIPVPEPGQWQRYGFRTGRDVRPLLDRVAADLQAAGYPDKDVFAVRLALAEAMSNALRHGHRGDRSKVAQLSYAINGTCIVAEVQDQGAGFDPAAVPDPCAPENLEKPGGRGLLLMHSYMNWVCHNGRGNRVTLCRVRGGEGSAANPGRN
jgi:serine/threonine-protein kinase RsbW